MFDFGENRVYGEFVLTVNLFQMFICFVRFCLLQYVAWCDVERALRRRCSVLCGVE